MPFTSIEASQSITAAEHSLPRDAGYSAASPQSDPGVLGISLNVSDLVLGDEVLLKVYETIDGEQLPVYEVPIAGPFSSKHFKAPDFMVGPGWDVTLKWISGAERTIAWRLMLATAAESSADIAAAIGARLLWAGFSYDRVMRIMASILAGKKSGDTFRNLIDTLDQVTGTSDEDGDRTAVAFPAP